MKVIEVGFIHSGNFQRDYLHHEHHEREYKRLLDAWDAHLKDGQPLLHAMASDAGNPAVVTLVCDA